MHTRRIARYALTSALTLTALAASLSAGPGMVPHDTAHAAICADCGGGGGGGGGGGTPPTAYVVMGDSFASGEGGLWNGNPALGAPDSVAIRASDPTAVYGQTWYWPGMWFTNFAYEQGCHRSDVAESTVTGIASRNFNIACSGATTDAVLNTSFKTESPQIQQLQTIAAQNKVKLIVLSIGGNNLNFSGIIKDCVTTDVFGGKPCAASEQFTIDGNMLSAMGAVSASVDAIETTMQNLGYSASAYRLIVQGYPSPIPASATMVSSANNARTLLGCPFYSADADWAHNVFVPEFGWNLRQVVSDRNAVYHNVQFLDLSRLFEGHEVCSTATTRPSQFAAPNPATNEWARALAFAQPLTPDQAGYHNESFHPNAFGQQAIGRCIALLNTMPATGDYSCTGAPNISPSQVQLAPMDNNTYRFVNVNSGRVMALNGSGYFTNGDPAILWDDNGTSDHNWQLVPEGNGYYKIRNAYSGKVLGVTNWGANASPVVEWDDNGTPDHDWKVVYGVQGGFEFVNRYSGMYLTADPSGANGTALVQSQYTPMSPLSSWQFFRN